MFNIDIDKWLYFTKAGMSVDGAGHISDMERIPQALAASLVSLIPIIVVFAIFQKKIIGSIVFSAVKG